MVYGRHNFILFVFPARPWICPKNGVLNRNKSLQSIIFPISKWINSWLDPSSLGQPLPNVSMISLVQLGSLMIPLSDEIWIVVVRRRKGKWRFLIWPRTTLSSHLGKGDRMVDVKKGRWNNNKTRGKRIQTFWLMKKTYYIWRYGFVWK